MCYPYWIQKCDVIWTRKNVQEKFYVDWNEYGSLKFPSSCFNLRGEEIRKYDTEILTNSIRIYRVEIPMTFLHFSIRFKSSAFDPHWFKFNLIWAVYSDRNLSFNGVGELNVNLFTSCYYENVIIFYNKP